jgi:hypothetical protein
VQYDGFLSAMEADPGAALLAIVATACAIASGRRSPAMAAVAFLWIAVDLYLIKARPHGTSLTSASLGFLFLIAALPTRTMEIFPAMAALGVGLLMFPSSLTIRTLVGWTTQPPKCDAAPSEITNADIVYVPTNDWNMGTPIQLFGYNGHLGTYFFDEKADGRLAYRGGGKAFALLFPERLMALGNPGAEAAIDRSVRAGSVLGWTRRVFTTQQEQYAVISAICSDPAIACHERPLMYNGAPHLVGQARAANQ